MVRRAASPIRIVHVDMTLTRSKVKVKVKRLLKFRKLHFSRSLLRHFGVELKIND